MISHKKKKSTAKIQLDSSKEKQNDEAVLDRLPEIIINHSSVVDQNLTEIDEEVANRSIPTDIFDNERTFKNAK